VECQGSIHTLKECIEPGPHVPGGREGRRGWDDESFQVAFQGRPVSQGPVGREWGITKKGSIMTDKDKDVIEPHRGERIRPFREIVY